MNQTKIDTLCSALDAQFNKLRKRAQKEAYKIVLRVEHEESSLGPVHHDTCSSLSNLMAYEVWEDLPSPCRDVGKYISGDEVCAIHDPDMFLKWFPETLHEELADNGFVVRFFMIPEYAIEYGTYQCVFERTEFHPIAEVRFQ